MKRVALVAALILALPLLGLDGQVGIHDPSTIVECKGKFYTFGTGGGSLVSEDGFTWKRSGTLPRRAMAPDVIHIGDRYYAYAAANVGAQPRADIHLLINKTLDPDAPDYKWEEGGLVAASDGVEDCNAIDPGLLLDPVTKKLWLTYGSYFGYIKLVELDPKTGKRANPAVAPVNIAINSEASILTYHDGWYYLLVTHGSCCRGADSGYNIRMGRSRKITGPYLDNMGVDMIQGGGKLFLTSQGKMIGPGHFGRIFLGDGMEKFSMHYEADLDRGGASVLDIRPLLWRDGWPVAGENAEPGTYQLESARTGTVLELAVEGFPVGGRPVRRGPPPGAKPGSGPPPPGSGGGMFGGIGRPIPPQDVNEVLGKWPTGNIETRMANYMSQAQQKWRITPASGGGGYWGSPYFKITIEGTDRALGVNEDGELITTPAFQQSDSQLWRFDQLTDGTWRITPKSKQDSALSAIGSSFATLSKFDGKSDKQRWLLKRP